MKNTLHFDASVQLSYKILSLKWVSRRNVFLFYLICFCILLIEFTCILCFFTKCDTNLYFYFSTNSVFPLLCAYVQQPIIIWLLCIYCELTFGNCKFAFDNCTIAQDFKLKMGPLYKTGSTKCVSIVFPQTVIKEKYFHFWCSRTIIVSKFEIWNEVLTVF